jgi:hypothetical protein
VLATISPTRRLDDLPLSVIGEAVGAVPVYVFVAHCERARAKVERKW